jgi:hypothetical protein
MIVCKQVGDVRIGGDTAPVRMRLGGDDLDGYGSSVHRQRHIRTLDGELVPTYLPSLLPPQYGRCCDRFRRPALFKWLMLICNFNDRVMSLLALSSLQSIADGSVLDASGPMRHRLFCQVKSADLHISLVFVTASVSIASCHWKCRTALTPLSGLTRLCHPS